MLLPPVISEMENISAPKEEEKKTALKAILDGKLFFFFPS